ncbi:MAG: glycosyltransferase [Polyangiaceae bacterium]
MAIGPVVKRDEATHENADLPVDPNGGPLVLALAGGGGQPLETARYLRAVADAHLLAKARISSLRTILITGPYAEPPAHLEGYEGLVVVRSSSHVMSWMRQATLIVAQSGYNTIAEIRVLKKPSVLVPAYRKMEDQSARAKRLARVGAATIAKPEARSIANALESILTRPDELERMREAHDRWPLVPANREVAEALLRVVRAPTSVKKIALVAHDFAPKIGGMETVARSLAIELMKAGKEVVVYTTRRLGADVAHGLGERVVKPIFDVGVGGRRIHLADDLLALTHALQHDLPDVVHLCNAGLAPWAHDISQALPTRVSISVHGNDLLVPWVHHELDEDAYKEAQAKGLEEASVVFPVSRFSAGLASLRGARRDRTVIVTNGVDPSQFAPSSTTDARRHALAERLGLPSDSQVVLTVSRMIPRKGHATTIKAIARLRSSHPKIRFVVTGAGLQREELTALATKLGVRDRVVFAGVVAPDELAMLYHLANVFVLAPEAASENDVEGFGVTLLEAAAAGLPVIGSRSGGVPEALREGQTGWLITPGDDEDLASKIVSLLDDPKRARELGAAGQTWVSNEQSWSRVAERMIEAWAKAEPSTITADSAKLIESAKRRARDRYFTREHRRRQMRASIHKGKHVRLRATGDGARYLLDALEDCASIGIRPDVEVKLRRLLDPDFLAYAVPHLRSIRIVHNVPTLLASDVQQRVEALPEEVLRKIHVVRVFLTEQAHAEPSKALAAVPEVYRLRRTLAQRGVTVVPPPELMRYLSETPAGGPETGMIEPTNLCNLGCPTCPTGTGKIAPLPEMTVDRVQHHRSTSPSTEKPRAVELRRASSSERSCRIIQQANALVLRS